MENGETVNNHIPPPTHKHTLSSVTLRIIRILFLGYCGMLLEPEAEERLPYRIISVLLVIRTLLGTVRRLI
jgi:hypothetical protein